MKINIKYAIVAEVGVLILIGVAVFLVVRMEPEKNEPSVAVRSFEECVKAGYPVMESYPRQCKAPGGLTYAEEIPEQATYVNASADLITVDLPFPGAVVGKEFRVAGKARGTWYFEASFPVEVVAPNGAVLAQGPAQAQGEWMTTEFVPFTIDLAIPKDYIGPATLVLKKDNPSGMPENDASMSLPITIEY